VGELRTQFFVKPHQTSTASSSSSSRTEHAEFSTSFRTIGFRFRFPIRTFFRNLYEKFHSNTARIENILIGGDNFSQKENDFAPLPIHMRCVDGRIGDPSLFEPTAFRGPIAFFHMATRRERVGESAFQMEATSRGAFECNRQTADRLPLNRTVSGARMVVSRKDPHKRQNWGWSRRLTNCAGWARISSAIWR
jgi:hypothetical protein